MAACIFHYVMAIMEGALSGVLFYEAEKETHKKRRILFLIASMGWFILSLVDSFHGMDALKELREKDELINVEDEYE